MTHYRFDPLDKFVSAGTLQLQEAVGILPMWFKAACGLSIGGSTRDVFNEMVKMYGFGDHEMKGGVVEMDGTYVYPQDPPMYPLLTLRRPGCVAHFYEHAMFSLVGPDETIVTRMD